MGEFDDLIPKGDEADPFADLHPAAVVEPPKVQLSPYEKLRMQGVGAGIGATTGPAAAGSKRFAVVTVKALTPLVPAAPAAPSAPGLPGTSTTVGSGQAQEQSAVAALILADNA